MEAKSEAKEEQEIGIKVKTFVDLYKACIAIPSLHIRRVFCLYEQTSYAGKNPFRAMKPLENGGPDLEGGKSEKERDRDRSQRGGKGIKMQNQALISGAAYCLSSCSMILVNKFVLSSYNFNAGISLMVYQVISSSFSALCVL